MDILLTVANINDQLQAFVLFTHTHEYYSGIRTVWNNNNQDNHRFMNLSIIDVIAVM